jgi:hypothetical protein
MEAMKTLSGLLLCSMAVFCACEDRIDSDPNMVPTEPKTVTMPFKAVYQGNNTFTGQNREGCIPDFQHVVEIANGKGNYVGYSSFHSIFCTNISTISPGLSYILTQQGDTLFLSFSGKTCVGLGEQEEEEDGEHPDEIYCWQLPFTILGGTGAFEGAMGEGTTNDYLSSAGNTYYHVWEGTITLQKIHFGEVKDY